MQFGAINAEGERISLAERLPEARGAASPPVSVVSGAGPDAGPATVRIGASTWARADWVGSVYPPGTAPGGRLSALSEVLDAVELSGVAYGLPPEDRLRTWCAAVPTGFRFVPKLPRGLTHGRRPDPEFLDQAMQRMATLGKQLGTINIQLPDRLAPDERATESIRELLSRGSSAGVPLSLELRHPAWFAGDMPDRVEARLREYRVSWTITDTVGRPDVLHCRLPVDRVLVRYVAVSVTAEDERRLDAWARTLAAWSASGLREATVILHCDDGSLMLSLAARLAERVRELGLRCRLPGETL